MCSALHGWSWACGRSGGCLEDGLKDVDSGTRMHAYIYSRQASGVAWMVRHSPVSPDTNKASADDRLANLHAGQYEMSACSCVPMALHDVLVLQLLSVAADCSLTLDPEPSESECDTGGGSTSVSVPCVLKDTFVDFGHVSSSTQLGAWSRCQAAQPDKYHL